MIHRKMYGVIEHSHLYLCLCAGLAQYSGDPRIEWHLNAHTTKEAVIDAVKNLPYKGGNTLTGTLPSEPSASLSLLESSASQLTDKRLRG